MTLRFPQMQLPKIDGRYKNVYYSIYVINNICMVIINVVLIFKTLSMNILIKYY
jgi:hypothetical protein